MVTEQQTGSKCSDDPICSPRISFSGEFLDESNFISICPNPSRYAVAAETHKSTPPRAAAAADFEFLSAVNSSNMMITADELISEGKLLPYRQIEKKLGKISLKKLDDDDDEMEVNRKEPESRISWFLDDDPSPRPPKCTVLWKELLRLRKNRGSSTLSSSSSNCASFSSNLSLESEKKEVSAKGNKKGLGSIRIRPVVNVPICAPVTAGKSGGSSGLPPLFSMRRGGGRL